MYPALQPLLSNEDDVIIKHGWLRIINFDEHELEHEHVVSGFALNATHSKQQDFVQPLAKALNHKVLLQRLLQQSSAGLVTS